MALINLKPLSGVAPPEMNKSNNQFVIDKFNMWKGKMLSCIAKNKKGTSFCASFLKASYTIEATVVLPIFLTMMMFGVFLFRIVEVQTGVQYALDMTAREFAVINELDGTKETMAAVVYCDEQIAANKVSTNYIFGSYLGIDYSKSSCEGNYVHLIAQYSIRFPLGLLGNYDYRILQESKARKWVGFDHNESLYSGIYAYISRYSEVYHIDRSCTYLNPGIESVTKAQLLTKRNSSGHKYYPCKKCNGRAGQESVYVTPHGTNYHSTVGCTYLKHDVKKIPFEEAVVLYPPCSKCSGGKNGSDDVD